MAQYQVSSPTGEVYQITADNDQAAQDAMQSLVDAHSPGAAEAFGRGALRNFPLAQQAVAGGESYLGIKPYERALMELTGKAEEAKQASPLSYGAGAVAGAAAPLAIPGIGAGMEAFPAAANALLGAAQGISDIPISKQPLEALKQAGIGAGVGSALGSLVSKLTPEASTLENFAAGKDVQSIGLKPGMLGIPQEEYENLGKTVYDLGLEKGSTQDRFQLADSLRQQAGAQIGDLGAGAQPLQDASPYINELQKQAEQSAKIFGPDAQSELTVYRQGMANLKPGMTFDDLQQLKTTIGQRAFDMNGDVKNTALADVYGQVKQAMKDIVSSSPEEYQDAMSQYGTLSDISEGLKRQLQEEQAQGAQGRGFGLVGKLMGMVGKNPALNVGAAAALTPVHPFMAAGALTPILMNPQAMAQATRGIASAIEPTAQAITATTTDALISHLTRSPQALGPYAKPLLQAAQSGGRDGVAATHYILATSDPRYNEMIQKISEKHGENSQGDSY